MEEFLRRHDYLQQNTEGKKVTAEPILEPILEEKVSDEQTHQRNVPVTEKASGNNSSKSSERPAKSVNATQSTDAPPKDSFSGRSGSSSSKVQLSRAGPKAAAVTDTEDDEPSLGKKTENSPIGDKGEASTGEKKAPPSGVKSTNEKQPETRQRQSVEMFDRHEKVAKRLVEVSQDLLWDFIPKEGSVLVHSISKRFWARWTTSSGYIYSPFHYFTWTKLTK
jgi:hypothetical protein